MKMPTTRDNRTRRLVDGRPMRHNQGTAIGGGRYIDDSVLAAVAKSGKMPYLRDVIAAHRGGRRADAKSSLTMATRH